MCRNSAQHKNRLPRAVRESPSLEEFKESVCGTGDMVHIIQCERGGELMAGFDDLRGLFQL